PGRRVPRRRAARDRRRNGGYALRACEPAGPRRAARCVTRTRRPGGAGPPGARARRRELECPEAGRATPGDLSNPGGREAEGSATKSRTAKKPSTPEPAVERVPAWGP